MNFQDLQGNSFSLSVLETTPLRDVQQMLVRWMGLSFPVYSATLTKPDGETCWDFKSEPFKNATEGETYLVQSELTGDMYFFDKMFRNTTESKT